MAYDQALYGLAHKAGIAMIDATETIHAFHQTDEAGNYAGHKGRKCSNVCIVTATAI